ncbi:hypothetical protein GGI42DRAFT_35252 [Trichoderma sp. SZMC 28013]
MHSFLPFSSPLSFLFTITLQSSELLKGINSPGWRIASLVRCDTRYMVAFSCTSMSSFNFSNISASPSSSTFGLLRGVVQRSFGISFSNSSASCERRIPFSSSCFIIASSISQRAL